MAEMLVQWFRVVKIPLIIETSLLSTNNNNLIEETLLAFNWETYILRGPWTRNNLNGYSKPSIGISNSHYSPLIIFYFLIWKWIKMNKFMYDRIIRRWEYRECIVVACAEVPKAFI